MLDLTDDLIAELAASDGYLYAGSPYSLYDGGLEEAARLACRAAGYLIWRGLNVVSPIVHSHAVAAVAGLNPLDHDLWMRVDRPLMEGAEGLIVVRAKGWERSKGLAEEIEFFRESCLPIYGYDPG